MWSAYHIASNHSHVTLWFSVVKDICKHKCTLVLHTWSVVKKNPWGEYVHTEFSQINLANIPILFPTDDLQKQLKSDTERKRLKLDILCRCCTIEGLKIETASQLGWQKTDVQMLLLMKLYIQASIRSIKLQEISQRLINEYCGLLGSP